MVIFDRNKEEYIVKCNSNSFIIVSPFYEQGRYDELVKIIEKEDLNKPTILQIVSFIYSVCLSKNKIYEYSSGFCFKAFNGILWTDNGIYIQDNPKLIYDKIDMEEVYLRSQLHHCEKGSLCNDNKTIRFTNREYKRGEQYSWELKNNSLVSILLGEDGTNKLKQLAEKMHRYNTLIWGLNKPPKPIITIPALYFNQNSNIIILDAAYPPNNKKGITFGIKK